MPRHTGTRYPSGRVLSERTVIDYQTAVIAAGGTVSVATLVALNDFVIGCKTDGIWALLDFVWPCCGTGLAAARTLLKKPVAVAATMPNSGTFVEGDYVESHGLTGNGTSKYLNTGYNPTLYQTTTTAHLSVYCTDYGLGAVVLNEIEFGEQSGQNHFLRNGSGRSDSYVSNRNIAGTSLSPAQGLLVMSIIASGVTNYWNASSTGTTTVSTPLLPNANMALFALGPSGGSFRSTKTLGFASAGLGLTSVQVSLLNVRVATLMSSLGRVDTAVTATTNKNGFLATGQSLSIALQTESTLSAGKSPGEHVMFQSGMHPGGAALTSLVPMRNWNNNSVGPGCGPAFTQTLALKTIGGDFFGHNTGVSGAPYSSLKKGTAPYTNGTTEATAANGLLVAAGRTLTYSSVLNVHGESDDANANTSYDANLLEWRTDLNTDLKAITGQSADLVFIYSQTASWAVFSPRTTPVTAPLMLAAHVANPTFMLLACPKYFMTHRSDGTHIPEGTVAWIDEYYAKAYKAVVIDAGSWTPLRPLSVSRSGANITIVFSKGGLVFDTSLVSDPAGTYASRKFGTAPGSATDTTVTNKLGFEFCDDNATNPSAAISGFNGQGLVVANINANFTTTTITGDTLTVNLDGTPTQANKRIRYAYSMTSGAKAGPTTGPRGNLRDADTSFASVYGNTMYNWCVVFDEAAT